MSEQITIDLTVQVEKIAEQIVRAKPLGPWFIQVVGSSWRDVQGRLQKKLEKEIPKVLPSQWYEGCLPSKHLRSITKVVLPREKNNICLSSPIEVPLETFRWELPEGQAVVKIPAAACTLFAKSSDLTDEVIAQNAKVALIRLTEKMNLSQMRRRVAMHEYEFHNLSVTTILGAKAQPKDPKSSFENARQRCVR